MSHAEFLRQLTEEDEDEGWVVRLVRTLDQAGRDAAQGPLADGVSLVLERLEAFGLTARDLALVRVVVSLTLRPGGMTRRDLAALEAVGLSSRECHDVVHVVCCFAYMNRLADGLGVTVNQEWAGWARKLFGDQAWSDHQAWSRGHEVSEEAGE